MRRNYDILWKGVLEEVFDDLLRFLFPNANELFDMEKGFEFLDKELAKIHTEPAIRSDTRFVDKLVKVYQRDGSEEWILVHVEVQGTNDPEFAERMFKYYYRIFDRYNRPVTAIAILTGRDGKNMTDRYERSYLGTKLAYQYNTLCILDFTDKELEENENIFALVLLAAKKTLLKGKDLDKRLLNEKLLIARMLFERGLFSKKKLQGIWSFLNLYVQFENPETNHIFVEQIDLITGKKDTMGVIEQLAEIRKEEGREEGRTEKEIIVVKNLLSATKFSLEKIASIAGVSVAFVKEIKKEKK